MKIGILTFHSEINYGSVLQTYAVQETFKSLGNDVEIIDRWMDCNNRYARGLLNDMTLKKWVKVILRIPFDVGVISRLIRYLKTATFKRRYLKMSNFSFYNWRDAPADMNYDVVSVGSDQVWNANLFDPNDYLLEHLPDRTARMSYAASIGMNAIPCQYVENYRQSLLRFAGVSVREQSAVGLLAELGICAQKVLDPTLVVDKRLWDRMIGGGRREKDTKRLIVYVLAEDMQTILPKIECFCVRNRCRASVFVDNWMMYGRKSIKGLVSAFRFRLRLMREGIKLCLSAHPGDFVREVASATWVVTNSFHALMFSTIYRRDVRVVKPTNVIRLQMHSRMQEFEGTIIKGPLMQDSVEAALKSIETDGPVAYDEDLLQINIDETKEWIKKTLKAISVKRNLSTTRVM